jgi:hypothetical protein
MVGSAFVHALSNIAQPLAAQHTIRRNRIRPNVDIFLIALLRRLKRRKQRYRKAGPDAQ